MAITWLLTIPQKVEEVLTRHANLKVGRSGRRLLLVGCLSKPCLDGKDDSDPEAHQYEL